MRTEQEYTSEYCIELLKSKYDTLLSQGERRFPKRSDFTEREVIAIKARLGPWPRALERAELKPPRTDDRLEMNHQKRILSKRRRTQAKISEKELNEKTKNLT